MSIFALFSQLGNVSHKHLFTVAPVTSLDGIYFGVDRAVRPCLFVSARTRLLEPPLRTARISLNPNQTYQLTLKDGSQQIGIFHGMFCETADRSDAATFMVLVEAFLAKYSDLHSASQNIVPFFRSMARLFEVEPARDLDAERQGLWGELFMMRQVRGYNFWAPFWHSKVTNLFDFSAPGKRLEVKTASGGQRIHHFSHRQVYALDGEEIMLASLLVREEDTGLSLCDLISECRLALLHTPYYLKFEKAVRHASMEDPLEVGPIYNPVEAALALACFRSIDAPHFNMPEPSGVSQTSYRVDLTNAPRLDIDQLSVWLDSWPNSI